MFLPQSSQPVDAGLGGVVLNIVNPIKVSTTSNTGNEVFKQTSSDSANEIKIPTLGQP